MQQDLRSIVSATPVQPPTGLALASAASGPIMQLPHTPLSPYCRTKPTETGAGGEVLLHPTARASFSGGQTVKGSCF